MNGNFGTVPETIHEKVFHRFRLLVANHPFVDANKRTALNTTAVFYFLNGYQFGTDQTTVDETETVEYLRSHTEEIDLVGEIEQWRDDLIQYGLNELTGGSEFDSPLDEVMDDIRRELVQQVATADRDANRDIYDALENE